jgi:hypothetical protein
MEMHSEKLHNLNASPNIIRMIKSRKMRFLVGKPEGKRPLRRPRHQ